MRSFFYDTLEGKKCFSFLAMSHTDTLLLMNYNVNCSYDSDLKEVAENPTEMALHTKALLAEAQATKNPLRQAKLKGQAGAFLKTLRKLDAAEKELQEALVILKDSPAAKMSMVGNNDSSAASAVVSPAEILEISLRLRLYDTYRYQNKMKESETGFKQLLMLTEIGSQHQNYRDFTLQHLGKLYFNLGAFDQAMECFEEALALRVVKEDDALIDSTEKAMQATLYAKHQGGLQA